MRVVFDFQFIHSVNAVALGTDSREFQDLGASEPAVRSHSNNRHHSRSNPKLAACRRPKNLRGFSMTTTLPWCAWRSADSREKTMSVLASATNSKAVPFRPRVPLKRLFSPGGAPFEGRRLVQIARGWSDSPFAPRKSTRHKGHGFRATRREPEVEEAEHSSTNEDSECSDENHHNKWNPLLCMVGSTQPGPSSRRVQGTNGWRGLGSAANFRLTCFAWACTRSPIWT